MTVPTNMPGLWADTLTPEEVGFTKAVAKVLSNIDWTKPLLAEAKISRALNCAPDPNRPYDDRLEIKSALFEVRFAYAIHHAECTAKYEHNAGVGGSSVDFLICGKENQPNWLVELTSLRDSKATHENTWQSGPFFGYGSVPVPGENSPEVRDIVKAQQAILHKVTNKKGHPIKFPLPNAGAYNLIAVDVRALNLELADGWDFHNIVYGSHNLMQIEVLSVTRGLIRLVSGNS